MLEAAPSGRAKCRACGQTIAKGDVRFGEALPNPYGEGETQAWFHLVCAACARPESVQGTLADSSLALADREWLWRAVQFGIEHPRAARIARAERASSGRATCRQCRELIEKGAFRIALHMFEEGRMSPIGTIHARCGAAYFGTIDVVDRIERLTPELQPDDLAEIATLLEAGKDAAPGLAKTRPSEPPLASAESDAAKSGT